MLIVSFFFFFFLYKLNFCADKLIKVKFIFFPLFFLSFHDIEMCLRFLKFIGSRISHHNSALKKRDASSFLIVLQVLHQKGEKEKKVWPHDQPPFPLSQWKWCQKKKGMKTNPQN